MSALVGGGVTHVTPPLKRHRENGGDPCRDLLVCGVDVGPEPQHLLRYAVCVCVCVCVLMSAPSRSTCFATLCVCVCVCVF